MTVSKAERFRLKAPLRRWEQLQCWPSVFTLAVCRLGPTVWAQGVPAFLWVIYGSRGRPMEPNDTIHRTLDSCDRRNRSIREDSLRVAKNIQCVSHFLGVAARPFMDQLHPGANLRAEQRNMRTNVLSGSLNWQVRLGVCIHPAFIFHADLASVTEWADRRHSTGRS